MALEKRAKEIAYSMNMRGLYPWHVKKELELQCVPAFEQNTLEELVTEELKKLQGC